jgi:hypothetical protein
MDPDPKMHGSGSKNPNSYFYHIHTKYFHLIIVREVLEKGGSYK